MSDVRQAITGILAALVSAVIILGSIILALTETGQRVARLPETNPTMLTPLPPVDTPEPGEPTFTAAPTDIPQRPTPGVTFNCPPRPGWQPIEVFAGDTLEELAQLHGTSLETLLEGNCLDPEDVKNPNRLIGLEIYVPWSQPTASFTPTGTATATATATSQEQANKPKTGQKKPKSPPCGPPSYWVRYTVRSGDNLTRIALATGTTVSQLRTANCLTSTLIRTGQRLWVPRLPPVSTPLRSPTPRPTRTATLTRTSVPTIAPSDTPVPTNTERPTDPPPPAPSDTPVPSDTPLPTAYP